MLLLTNYASRIESIGSHLMIARKIITTLPNLALISSACDDELIRVDGALSHCLTTLVWGTQKKTQKQRFEGLLAWRHAQIES